MREIEVQEARSSQVGGCSACTDHVGPGHDYPVYQVTLRSMTFRLCGGCLSEFRAKTDFAKKAKTPKADESSPHIALYRMPEGLSKQEQQYVRSALSKGHVQAIGNKSAKVCDTLVAKGVLEVANPDMHSYRIKH